MTSGFATTSEAGALVTRAARHFAHKVPVREDGAATAIETRFGVCELRPSSTGIEIALDAADEEAERQLQQVIQSHLERFARASLRIDWQAQV